MYAILMGATIAMTLGKNTRKEYEMAFRETFTIGISFLGRFFSSFYFPSVAKSILEMQGNFKIQKELGMGGQLAHKNHATVCDIILFLECDCQSTSFRLGLVRW